MLFLTIPSEPQTLLTNIKKNVLNILCINEICRVVLKVVELKSKHCGLSSHLIFLRSFRLCDSIRFVLINKKKKNGSQDNRAENFASHRRYHFSNFMNMNCIIYFWFCCAIVQLLSLIQQKVHSFQRKENVHLYAYHLPLSVFFLFYSLHFCSRHRQQNSSNNNNAHINSSISFFLRLSSLN